jgi:ABC-2 type transport system permease protein
MKALAGTRGLIRLILRRDRIVLPVWILVLAVLPATYASATEQLFPTQEALDGYYASIVANPALLSTVGPVFGANLGALTAWRSGIVILFVGLACLLTVIRHTRAEEDAGRRELLGATVVGRHAPLAAALAVTFAAALATGLIMAGSLLGYGLPGAGSLALGLSFALAGWIFAGVGALAAQLTSSAGGARGIALTVLGGAFALRAAGDSGGESGDLLWLSWLSPYGWTQRVRPYADEQWWVFALGLGASIAVVAAAVALVAHRDVGAGMLAPRLGPASAGSRLRGPFGLAWRLHRGLLVGWTAGFAALGALIGGAAESVDTMVSGSPELADMLARLGGTAALKDAYIAASLSMLALAVSAYAIQAALRARAEETALRAEPVLATSLSRTRWLASHAVFAAFGPAVVLAVLGVCVGLASGAAGGSMTGDTTGDTTGGGAGRVGEVLVAAMVRLPAVWILAGLALALFGLLPRVAVPAAWGALAVCAFLGLVGALLRLDQWVLDLAPFAHVPNLPGGEVTVAPLLWLPAVAVALTVTGLAGFRRRDLAA